MQPLIKYTGSKRFFAAELAEKFPKYSKAFIPFCGGGSFLPYLSGDLVVSDVCRPLIDAFNSIKYHPELTLSVYENSRNRCVADMSYYYKLRDSFNNNQTGEAFLVLTRLAYNGLIRWNKDGKFNSSFHHNRKGIEPHKLRKIFEDWLPVLNRTEFICEDYRKTFDRAKKGDFTVLDPPYFDTVGQYQSESFDFNALWGSLEELSVRDVKWLLCLNSDLDLSRIPQIYKNYWSTIKKSSSFNRLKKNDVKNGNTIFANY